MRHFVRTICALCVCVLASFNAEATTVSLNADSAKAVLEALQNPKLTHAESLRIAMLPGNKGIVKKTREFGFDATPENFAADLYDAAHGLVSKGPEEKSYQFEMVKPKAPQLLILLQMISGEPQNFAKPIEARVAQFSPPGADLQLEGYIVAAGDGGGYAFGGSDFYLNIGVVDEAIVAKVTTTHELYHAVQGAFAKERGTTGELSPSDGMSAAEQACRKTAQLFANIYEEGSATYVGDIALLQGGHSDLALRQTSDLADGLKHAQASASLLEMSVLSFNAKDSMGYNDVYEVGFFGHGVLYNIAYVMAKDIAEQDGPGGLAAFLTAPPSTFILRYTQLRAYGKDSQHPKLGSNTIRTAEAGRKGCTR